MTTSISILRMTRGISSEEEEEEKLEEVFIISNFTFLQVQTKMLLILALIQLVEYLLLLLVMGHFVVHVFLINQDYFHLLLVEHFPK